MPMPMPNEAYQTPGIQEIHEGLAQTQVRMEAALDRLSSGPTMLVSQPFFNLHCHSDEPTEKAGGMHAANAATAWL